MTFSVDDLKGHLPYYLSAKDQTTLTNELNAIISGGTVSYFLSGYSDKFGNEMLQGDGWRGFQLFLFESGERRSVRGLVLSNSCDVDTSNRRDTPPRVTFAPLVRLSKYKELLESSGLDQSKINAKLVSIKSQKTTSIFYLPAGGPLEEDHLARFDEAYSMPLAAHERSDTRKRLFTLSNTGFYMLIFKLSIHFCRLQENVQRSSASELPSEGTVVAAPCPNQDNQPNG
jgi:hypothetical protein